MNRRTNKIITAALALIISAGATGAAASASAERESERDFARSIYSAEQSVNHGGEIFDSAALERNAYGDAAERGATIDAWEIFLSLSKISNKNVNAYGRKSVMIGGKTLALKSLTINGKDYIPSRQTAEALGLRYVYTAATKTVELSGGGLSMTFSNGCYVTYANGRTLFSLTPSMIMSDGRMYVPADIFAKAFGMRLSSEGGSVKLSGSFSPILSADKYYRSDEVFWLARIIHAEAQGEPLLGQIAVGNVVLNRVRSAYYPNTIFGVIFDRKYGVQFSPTIDGSIYNNPSYNSILAAKICLEGTDVSDGAFFFLRPEISSSSWIPKNRKYAFSIGKHDFYY